MSVHPSNLVAVKVKATVDMDSFKKQKIDTQMGCANCGDTFQKGDIMYVGDDSVCEDCWPNFVEDMKLPSNTKGSKVTAAPKKDGKKKVVPADKPDSRGSALQEEDLTKRAKSKSTEREQPPVLEHMKKGPDSISKETAKTADEASPALASLVNEAKAAQDATEKTKKAAKDSIKKAKDKVDVAQKAESDKVQAVIDEMEKTGIVVARILEDLLALDSSKTPVSPNVPETGALRMRREQAVSLLKSIKEQAKDQEAVIKGIDQEIEEQYGATYNVKKRVSLFPASLRASIKVAAGIGDIFTGLLEWAKGVLGIAEDASKAVDSFIKEFKAAGKGGDKVEEKVEDKVEEKVAEKVEDKGGEEEVDEKVEEKVEEKKEGE